MHFDVGCSCALVSAIRSSSLFATILSIPRSEAQLLGLRNPLHRRLHFVPHSISLRCRRKLSLFHLSSVALMQNCNDTFKVTFLSHTSGDAFTRIRGEEGGQWGLPSSRSATLVDALLFPMQPGKAMPGGVGEDASLLLSLRTDTYLDASLSGFANPSTPPFSTDR